MNSHDCRHGLILSSRIIAAHQAATLLERQGWQISIEYDEEKARHQIDTMDLDLLVVDIDSPSFAGILLLTEFHSRHPQAKALAMCSGGNSQSMRLARETGIDGYFFLQPHGMALDSMRGMARHCMPARQASYPLSDVSARAGHRMMRA